MTKQPVLCETCKSPLVWHPVKRESTIRVEWKYADCCNFSYETYVPVDDLELRVVNCWDKGAE